MKLKIYKNYMTLRNKPDGTIIKKLFVGDTADVISISDTRYQNGYQWVKVNYDNNIGYVQLDSNYIMIYDTSVIQYPIFPQKLVNITQNQYDMFSHNKVPAIDYANSNRYERSYAPSRCKVLAINSKANGVYFGTCDEYGNKCAVMCADGNKRVLTYYLMHDDNIDDIRIGKIYQSGEYFFNQGVKGYATGPHVHMEVAVGWVTNRKDIGQPSYLIDSAIDQSKIWWLLSGWSEILNLNGNNFKWTGGREHELM